MQKKYRSAFYEGYLGHRRYTPRYHDFKYQVCMCYIDLDEWPAIQKESRFWSESAWALARFSVKDFLDGEPGDLKISVKNKVAELTGETGIHRVCVLTNLRYFGFIMNPLTIYYCFDEKYALKSLLLEVTNTPWKERHFYALKCGEASDEAVQAVFKKVMHVSPFNPMTQYYEWESTAPKEHISVQMNCFNEGAASKQNDYVFSAALNLQRKAMTKQTLNRFVVRYPFMTLKIWAAIYWQAAKLFFKGVKVYDHPKPKNISTTGN